MKRNTKWLLLGIVFLAVLLRIGAVVALQSWDQPNAMEHQSIANFLVQGKGFYFISWDYAGPSSVQSPTYPLFLAGLFLLFGADSAGAYAAAMVINAVIGGVTAWLVFRLARVMGACERVGLLAAALFAVWPTQIYSATHAQAVVMIIAAMVAMWWLFYEAKRTGRFGYWLAFSVIAGIGALTEPALLPITAMAGFLVLLWRQYTLRQRLRKFATLTLCGLIIVGPWTVRNYQVHGKFMPVKSTFWVNVWKGNNPHATGTDRLPLTTNQAERLQEKSLLETDELARDPDFDTRRQYDMLAAEDRARLEGRPEVEREAIFQEITTAWIADNPIRYAELCGIRLVKTIWTDWDNPKAQNPVYLSFRALLLVLMFPGIVIAARRGWQLRFPAVSVFVAFLLYALTITAARFSIPFEPLGLIFVALTVVTSWQMLRRGADPDLSSHRRIADA